MGAVLPPSSGAQSGCSMSAPYGTRNTGIGRQRRQHTHRHTDTHQRANSPTTTRARDTKHTESPYTATTHTEWQMTPTRAQDARTGKRRAFTALFQTTPTPHTSNSTLRRQIFCGEGTPLVAGAGGRLGAPPRARTRAAVGTRARMHATEGTRAPVRYLRRRSPRAPGAPGGSPREPKTSHGLKCGGNARSVRRGAFPAPTGRALPPPCSPAPARPPPLAPRRCATVPQGAAPERGRGRHAEGCRRESFLTFFP